MHLFSGAMTAADMEALFKPVPFGATGHESPLSKVTIPSDFPVWDLFRNIDEERQNATLQVQCLLPTSPSLISSCPDFVSVEA